MKYIKKEVVIDAIQFTENNYEECKEFLEGNYDNALNYPNIKTVHGTVKVDLNDYICKDVIGAFYPCNKEVFEKTHRAIPSNGESIKKKIVVESCMECPLIARCEEVKALKSSIRVNMMCAVGPNYGILKTCPLQNC